MTRAKRPPLVPDREFRIAMANRVLSCFTRDTVIFHVEGRGITVSWLVRGEPIFRRWESRGQDFYPTWHKLWGHGGTASTALSQLVRWAQGRPVLPLSTWQYWCGETCRLANNDGAWLLKSLKHGAYPEVATCVLCQQPISGGLDWWHLDGVSGPCCSCRSGCRQERKAG